ncbi:MAG: hypothetical protein K2O65_02125, partial [Lachnospiraceae bacterium]|nr:hypothetical protein [Lachnospiraceae bacterium]
MKKRRSGFKLNSMKSNKKNKNIILIVIASIAAALGTAVFGILKWKKKKVSDGESENMANLNEEKISENMSVESKPQPPARFAHRKLQPGELDWETLAKEKEIDQIRRGEIPEDMLKGNDKAARGARRRIIRGRKPAFIATAMILVASLCSYNVLQHLRPAEALAKESFTGIGKIVSEHNEDDPYIILDIVPSQVMLSTASLNSADETDDDATDAETDSDVSAPIDAPTMTFSFSTGTMGYLAGGRVPFADDLEKAFTESPVFIRYANRDKFLNTLVPSMTAFPQIRYKEAYGGVLNAKTGGGTLLFPNQEVTVDDQYKITSDNDKSAMVEGIFRGSYLEYAGGDKTGYDFIKMSARNRSANKATGITGKYVYVFDDPDGDGIGTFFAVSLEQYATMPEGTPAYKASVSSEIDGSVRPEGYSDDIALYTYDEAEGRYVYQGTIGEVFNGQNNDGNQDDDTGDSDDGYTGNTDAGSETPEPTPTPDPT